MVKSRGGGGEGCHSGGRRREHHGGQWRRHGGWVRGRRHHEFYSKAIMHFYLKMRFMCVFFSLFIFISHILRVVSVGNVNT